MTTLALVLGGAECVWQDVRELLALATPDVVIATNDMIVHWPLDLPHAVTLHPQRLPGWLEQRRANALPAPGTVWSYRTAPHVDRVSDDWQGSSTLLALKFALFELRIDGAVLAGAPLDRSPHFVRAGPWTDARTFYGGWTAHKRQLMGRARSMSGWTKTLLGDVTAEWLAGLGAAPSDASLSDQLIMTS